MTSQRSQIRILVHIIAVCPSALELSSKNHLIPPKRLNPNSKNSVCLPRSNLRPHFLGPAQLADALTDRWCTLTAPQNKNKKYRRWAR